MPNKHRIPFRPTAIFCGKLMSREFTDGAYALRDALAQIDRLADEHPSAASIMDCIEKLMDSN